MYRTSAAILAALLTSACSADTALSPSPSFVLTASPRPSPSGDAPPPSAATPVPEATAAPTAAPAPPLARRFSVAQSFGAEGWLSQFLDVAHWDGRFIAISGSEKIMSDAREYRVWVSGDGTAWTSHPLSLPGESARPSRLVPMGGGSIAILGSILEATDTPGTWVAQAWESRDLSHWEASDLGIPDRSATAHAVAQGPKGYVAAVGNTIWYSSDGVGWTFSDNRSAGEVHAGGEGFVAVGSAGPDLARMDASGDGLSWHSGDTLPGWGLAVSAVGTGDWVAVAGSEEFEFFGSANGLEWERTTSVRELSGLSSGVGIDTAVTHIPLVTVAEEVFMTLAWNHCCAQLSGGRGVWSSTDGTEWVRLLDFDEGVVVAAGATDGDVIVLGGFVGRGGEGVLWASRPP